MLGFLAALVMTPSFKSKSKSKSKGRSKSRSRSKGRGKGKRQEQRQRQRQEAKAKAGHATSGTDAERAGTIRSGPSEFIQQRALLCGNGLRSGLRRSFGRGGKIHLGNLT